MGCVARGEGMCEAKGHGAWELWGEGCVRCGIVRRGVSHVAYL